MSNLNNKLPITDILQLTKDTCTAIEAHMVALPDRWTSLGTDGVYIWGDYNPSNDTSYHKNTIQTSLNMSLFIVGSHSYNCTCRQSRPCLHAIGLLLLFNEKPDLFTSTNVPEMVQNLEKRRQATTLSSMSHFKEISDGLAQLDKWLTNTIKQGLAEAHIREFRYWDEIADQMLASWMPALSQWLREIANIPMRGGDWVEPLLDELGLMYFLIKTFERYDIQPSEIQADLRQVIGIKFSEEEMQSQPMIRDTWVVIGATRRNFRGLAPEKFIWLQGIQSGQIALIHDIGSRQIMSSLITSVGQTVDLSLKYLPSRTPLKAHLIQNYADTGTTDMIQGTDIHNAIVQYVVAIHRNPWLRQYVVVLNDVYISRYDKHWTVRHADGKYLPIAPHFKHKWVMYAASNGHPVTVVGIWRKNFLYPLSIWTDSHVIDLMSVPDYKSKS